MKTGRVVSQRSTFDGIVYTLKCPRCGKEYDEHANAILKSPLERCWECYMKDRFPDPAPTQKP